MGKICSREKCTGCSACINSCPRDCIKMIEDEYGTPYPEIDKEKCINCNICKNICPENNEIKFNKPIATYAAWSLNEKVRKKSASGGIAWEMYLDILEHNGVAIGTKFDENMNLVHKAATSLKEISEFQGSKYVQSSTGKVFSEIKEYIKKGKKIIFIGTPCQVSGLKSFLKNKDIENVITVDLICHGVPPMRYLKEYLKYINLENKIDKITFRGENNWNFAGYKKEKVLYKKHNKEDFYYKSFLNGLFYRENCYQCKYAKQERVADITIGDFWGLGKDIPFNHQTNDGVSLILVNTQKGKKFLEEIKGRIYLEERTIEEAVKGNAQLNHPSKKRENTQEFKELYKEYGFSKAVEVIENKEE